MAGEAPEHEQVVQAATALDLLALTSSCTEATTGRYSSDVGTTANIPICKLPGAYFWKADMDVDCDGLRTAACNETTDPWFQNQTSALTSTGGWLDASTLPYVVIPLPSSRFDYRAAGLKLGSVVAVIYNGKINYGAFLDEGPNNIIGESSYAMAKSLGINPDPESGGTDSGVTYIAFTGSNAVVTKNEDHAQAVTIGQARATDLVRNAGGGGGTCTPESNATFCARLGKNCGTVSGTDNCGAARSASCGTCTSPQTCGGGGTSNVCGGGSSGGTGSCSFTVTQNVYDGPAWWGTIAFRNNGPSSSSNWQVSFNVPSGAQCDFAETGWTYSISGNTCTYRKAGTTLASGQSLSLHYSTNSQSFSAASNVVVKDSTCGAASCTPESNGAFCARLGKNCGSVTGADNCGASRTVSSCGSCTSPQTCGGGGKANVCGSPTCTPESNSAFCARVGKNCGSVTGTDNCGATRTVSSCGSCTSPDTCGGGGKTNVCGSPTGNPLTSGWTQKTFTYSLHHPYDLPVSDRYKFDAATNTHTFWIYKGDSPLKAGSPTEPRSEMRIQNDYISGNHQFEADVYVVAGTTGTSTMQVFGGTTHATSFMMHAWSENNGTLKHYGREVLRSNMYNRWFHLNVIHKASSSGIGQVQVYFDGALVGTFPDDGATTHYFKCGVYGIDGTRSETRFRNIKYWVK